MKFGYEGEFAPESDTSFLQERIEYFQRGKGSSGNPCSRKGAFPACHCHFVNPPRKSPPAPPVAKGGERTRAPAGCPYIIPNGLNRKSTGAARIAKRLFPRKKFRLRNPPAAFFKGGEKQIGRIVRSCNAPLIPRLPQYIHMDRVIRVVTLFFSAALISLFSL